MTQLFRQGALLIALLLSLVAPAGAALLQVGDMAPQFVLSDADGRDRSLTEWRGRWLVLYFYPRDNTPGCTAEAAAFRDRLPELTGLQAQVVGISVDSTASHRSFADSEKLPFPLLADVSGAVARRYGALSDLAIMMFAKRQTFLIDPEGRVALAYRDVDPTRHAAQVLADLKRLRAEPPRR